MYWDSTTTEALLCTDLLVRGSSWKWEFMLNASHSMNSGFQNFVHSNLGESNFLLYVNPEHENKFLCVIKAYQTTYCHSLMHKQQIKSVKQYCFSWFDVNKISSSPFITNLYSLLACCWSSFWSPQMSEQIHMRAYVKCASQGMSVFQIDWGNFVLLRESLLRGDPEFCCQ